MPYTESTLITADGLSLFVRTWTPNNAKAVLVLVHGLGEHAGRYPHVTSAFYQRGFVVFGHDHRGNGRSAGKRGDFARFDQILTDLDQVVTLARQKHPNLPLVVFGHSLGGMYATHYLAHHQAKIDAAILSAPGYGPGPDLNPVTIRLAGVLARVAPGFTLSTGGNKNFRLSHDPEAKAAYEADSLRHEKATARYANTNLQKATEAETLLAKLTLPTLVLLAGEDTVVNRQAILNAVAGAGPNVTFRQYPGCYHEMHNELPELRQPVLAETVAWVENVIHKA